MISWERYTIQARVGFSEVSILRSPRIKDLYASDLTQILSCKYFLPHGKWNCEIQEIPIQRWKSPKHISWIQPGIQVLVGLLTGQSFNDMKHNHPFVLTKNWMIIVPKQECNKTLYFVQKAPSSDAVSKFFIDLIPHRLPDSWLLLARWQQQQEKVWIKIHLWPFPRYSSTLFILWEWEFEYVCHHITFKSENS